MALGAGAGEIRWLVIRRGVGVVGTQFFSRLFSDPADTAARVRMSDPLMLAPMVLCIGAVAVVACLPAIRRATRVDPLVALRPE